MHFLFRFVTNHWQWWMQVLLSQSFKQEVNYCWAWSSFGLIIWVVEYLIRLNRNGTTIHFKLIEKSSFSINIPKESFLLTRIHLSSTRIVQKIQRAEFLWKQEWLFSFKYIYGPPKKNGICQKIYPKSEI